jgi:hypothetical protein
MPIKATSLALLSGATTLVLFGLANAQCPTPQAYRPGRGDLMTTTVQPRHTKPRIAGQEGNWAYAAYEFHELRESFDRASRAWLVYRKTNIAELLPATM